MLGAIAALCLLAATPVCAVFDLTQREILASGDVIPGLGVLGVRSFEVDGIDGSGRLLIRGETSSGDYGLFLADHNGLTPLWRGSERLSAAVIDAHGRVVALDTLHEDDTTLYEVAGGVLRPLLREGGPGANGETICTISRVALSDSGALAIGAESAAEPCQGFDWSQHIYVLVDGVLRTAVQFEGYGPPDLEPIGIAGDGTVLYTFDDGGPVFAARDGVTRTVAEAGMPGPNGPLGAIDALASNEAGEALFFAAGGDARGLYRSQRGELVRLLGQGGPLPSGERLVNLYETAALNERGDVAITADWQEVDAAGGPDGRIVHGVLFIPAGGPAQIIGRDASARGVNAAGAVALLSDGDPSGALRWQAGQTERIVAPGAPAPGGGALAIRGFDGNPNCLGADGRVGLYVASETTTGLLCGDASGFRAVARSGDPAPGGGTFAFFSVCGMPDGAELLFPAVRYGADWSETALYRATPRGIEVAIAPGSMLPGGETITELVSLGYLSDLRFNARGTLVTRARTDAGVERIVRQRRGQPPEIVRFALDGDPPIELSRFDEVEIAGDDSVIAIALIPGRYEGIVVSDGERARILIDRDDPRLPFDPHSFRRLIVRGDRAMFVACRGSTSADCGQFVAATDASLAPLLPDAREQTIVDYTPAGRALLQMRGGDSFLLDGALVGPIQTGGAEPLPIALNDRGNLLWRAFQSPLGGERHSLNLSGPPTESTDCFVPPTAVYQALPTPTPTIALPPTISPTPTSSATPTIPPPRCEDDADAVRCARLQVGSAAGRPGERVTVAVSLEIGLRVAGVQNDLYLLDVAPFAVAGNGRPSCRVNPEIGKSATSFAFLPTDCHPGVDCERVRALVIALDDTDPIPEGSVLYECDFDIGPDAAFGRYDLVPAFFEASTPEGDALTTLAFPGAIEVLGGGNAPVAEGGGGDGCAVGGPSAPALWPLGLAALLIIVRRIGLRPNRAPLPGRLIADRRLERSIKCHAGFGLRTRSSSS